MNVGELIEKLKELNPNLPVYFYMEQDGLHQTLKYVILIILVKMFV